jgi:pSer/pThr/pTyr-binding forkhead associated (FHA) protein
MLATVRLRLPDGSTTTLAPGDIIGRMASAALVLDDGRVSEAHAMVSLRGA